jgi:hypothetical protein
MDGKTTRTIWSNAPAASAETKTRKRTGTVACGGDWTNNDRACRHNVAGAFCERRERVAELRSSTSRTGLHLTPP